jgi:hypothetical protein
VLSAWVGWVVDNRKWQDGSQTSGWCISALQTFCLALTFHPRLGILFKTPTATQKMGLFQVDNHALVFGASGISGWAIVNQILSDYPAKGVFSAVTALTNRPLPAEYALWPKDSRLDVVSGLDLMKGSQEDLEASMKEKIKGIENVTQVFYFCKSASTTTHLATG